MSEQNVKETQVSEAVAAETAETSKQRDSPLIHHHGYRWMRLHGIR